MEKRKEEQIQQTNKKSERNKMKSKNLKNKVQDG